MVSNNDHVKCLNQIKIMEAAQKPGVIINMGSASGLYPMYSDPIYSGSKGWFYLLLMLFTLVLVNLYIWLCIKVNT